jgi:NAD(P)-dependent dehydrogenase (short-subunit alcohol dehydrogenase family)
VVRRLEGKRVLVFGGGTGLGYACAECMAREGANVFVAGRREGRLQEAVAKLNKIGPAGYAPGDATIEEDVQRITASAVSFMGGLDTLVNSAGTSGVASILEETLANFKRVSDANLLSTFLSSRYAAPHMVKNGSGSIIAISSMYGVVGQYERVAYCASKSGVIGMIRAIALDLANKGVRANTICPGFIETELAREIASHELDPEATLERRRQMHPIPRSGRPEEIGETAVFLASDASAWTTGQIISVDGGYTIRCCQRARFRSTTIAKNMPTLRERVAGTSFLL